MLRNGQTWDLGEPELNERRQPVIHDIAQKLGCIRPNSDIDLPVHSVFPEDEAGMAELARQLEEQQHHDSEAQHKDTKETDSPMYNRTDRASSSELDHSDIELDYRRQAFGSHNPMTMSPQSYAGSADFEFSRSAPPDLDTTALFATQSPSLSTFPDWTIKAAVPPRDDHAVLSTDWHVPGHEHDGPWPHWKRLWHHQAPRPVCRVQPQRHDGLERPHDL
ncbi:uncharacterized protein TrAtP1_008944 [Trichoderma atroviride]|uniref:uncharacterized protein n=1 Tax=Hypocrea atroviridis TaxID=63577 RepID=UPI00332A3EB7|nr:hypothetical protein TrAtP1_008944 [Trichoderma atroviride]